MRLKDERFGLTCQLSLMRFFSGAPQLGMMGLPGTWGSVWNILGGPNRGGAAGIRGAKPGLLLDFLQCPERPPMASVPRSKMLTLPG